MTRQRRTHVFILALVPVVVFGAVRCVDRTATAPIQQISAGHLEPSVEARLAKLQQEFGKAGKDHNDALAFVLQNLQRLPEKNRSRQAICETARKAFADFIQLRFGKNPAQSDEADFSRVCHGTSPQTRSAAIVFSGPGSARSDLSPLAQSYLDQIDGAIDASSSVEDLGGQIASIEADAAASLSYEEAGAVVMAGSVANSSASYWVQNIPAWGPYYLNTPDYSVLFSLSRTRDEATNGLVAPKSDWAAIWRDTKAAAKRAAGGDYHAAVRVIVVAGVSGAVIGYDAVVGAAAAGSIMAVLQI